jgi:hypothetical protein
VEQTHSFSSWKLFDRQRESLYICCQGIQYKDLRVYGKASNALIFRLLLLGIIF